MTPRPPHAHRFLAPAQVAELLDIGVDEVIALVHAGQLRGAPLGTPARWRIEEPSIEEYLDAQVEEARRMALWRQSQAASFPELWGSATQIV
ncbi:helix-turn-helix domain-containing protein [Microbacterium sp. BLY]|uniref:helix-turn-helix domain-containing protein n=1 Tax=Microbacterium sp. BLY TaxID=2823280 RepID=UPI001B31C589|nr:helix-turn-helix domain-containing protein [Microbacterium sp. BLY]MBP3978005.1 helix-turn-helix domain-containing protein [Microbacterium sp. BLY]